MHKRKKKKERPYGSKVTGGARCIAAVKKRKNKKTELILDAKCAKGKKMWRRGNLTGVRRRRAAARRCVRGSGVRRCVARRIYGGA